MKKIILLTVFALIMNVGFVFGQSKSMAVMPFEIVGNAVTEAEAEGITELYISELVSNGQITIVDRANFDKILKEMKFQNSDWSSSEKTAKLGQALNARFISRGKIMKLGKKMYLSATIVDVTTAKVVSSAQKEFENIDATLYMLKGFVKDIINGMVHYKVGDIGPGGGIVFKIQGIIVYEAVFLGELDWYTAMLKASSYKGGGYTDWHLPSRTELIWITESEDIDITLPEPYCGNMWGRWSCEEYTDTKAFGRAVNFAFFSEDKNEKYLAFAVRAF